MALDELHMELKQLGSGKDPVGSVYLMGSRVLRGIRQEYQNDYLIMLSQPIIHEMLGNRIVDTWVVPEVLPDYALTLEHQCIHPASYCYEWPMQMLQDAAVQTLDICLELNDIGFILKDATPWNILFDGPKPLLVDFTSIMPQEEDVLWVGYDQFFRLFMFPLLLGKFASGKLSRSLLLSSGNGISPDEITHLLPPLTWLKKPWMINRLYLPMLAMRMAVKSGQAKQIGKYSRHISVKSPARRSFFEAIKRDVSSVQFTTGKSRWSQYYEDINAFFDPPSFNAKQKVIFDLLQRYQPSSVVDIGCNQGGYSILAAQSGARVVAFDTDDDSVTSLYRLTKLKNLNILPLVCDVLYPPPQAGWRGLEFPSAPNRYRSQMAFGLALVHHLAFTQIQTFERIVQTLSDYTTRWLVTEFVPIDDPRSQELLLTNRRDLSWYTLDSFLYHLQNEFSIVEAYPSYPVGRTICFCQK